MTGTRAVARGGRGYPGRLGAIHDPPARLWIRGDADPTLLFLVRHRGRPIGFIQCYRIDDYDEYGQALELGFPAAGIDVFIGEPAEVGKGRGPDLIRAFLRDVVFPTYDVDDCVIGPSVRNVSAIRAYEKAGFVHFKDARVPDEPEPEHLMRIRREDLTRS